jgi:alkylated DNA repair protein alkB family protein 8
MDRIDGHVVWRKRRLSLTFRAIRHHPCSCPYYFFCDSQGYDQEKMKKHNPLLKKYIASKSKNTIVDMPPKAIEKEYVEKAYNSFGYTFSNPLHPKVLLFIESIPSGSLVLDIGCGNGVYLELIEKLGSLSLGIERCTVMGNTSIGHYEQRVLCDALRMPCKDGMFDYLLAIAVWHHFASEQSRKRLL